MNAQPGAGADIDEMFTTPLLRRVYPGSEQLNADLAALILERQKAGGGQAKSNAGGWQSREDMHRWPGQAVQALVARVAEMVNQGTEHIMRRHAKGAEISWRMLMWANVNHRGHYNLPHMHPGSTWSGVHYVDAGDRAADSTDAAAGAISFESPVPAALTSFFGGVIPSMVTIRPASGQMLLFPSYLTHFVHPYAGTRPRISIAFNVMRTPYP